MKPPCEVMVKSFLPAVRALVSRRLRELGYAQTEIAGMLGVTQAAVSNYLSADREVQVRKIRELGMDGALLESMLEELVPATMSSDTLSTDILYRHWSSLLSSGTVCNFHRAQARGLLDCELCLHEMKGGDPERHGVLASLREATKLVQASPTIARYIPEVYTNIVYCVQSAVNEKDVAGVPGRIGRRGGRALALGEPEFGASSHMAKVVLALRSRNPWVRSAINLKPDKLLLEWIATVVGHTPAVLDNYIDLEELFSRLKEALVSSPLDALVDPGGRGFEPNVYLLGIDPVSLCNIANSVATLASRGSRLTGAG